MCALTCLFSTDRSAVRTHTHSSGRPSTALDGQAIGLSTPGLVSKPAHHHQHPPPSLPRSIVPHTSRYRQLGRWEAGLAAVGSARRKFDEDQLPSAFPRNRCWGVIELGSVLCSGLRFQFSFIGGQGFVEGRGCWDLWTHEGEFNTVAFAYSRLSAEEGTGKEKKGRRKKKERFPPGLFLAHKSAV